MITLPLVDPNGIWHLAYFFGLALSIIAFIYYGKLWERDLFLSAKLLWAYLLIECLFVVEWPSAHFGAYTPSFQSTAAQVFIEIIFIPFMAVQFFGKIKKIIPYLALYASLCVWFGWTGFLHAPSFNMAMAAMCIPLLSMPLKLFVVGTALTHHGSTALLIMVAQIFALVLKKKIKWQYFVFGMAVTVASALVFQHQALFNSGERIQHWVEYMTFWAQNWRRIILGVSPGSFMWYSIMNHKYQTGFYLQMHNDWLQILWENGVVGLGLAIGVAYQTVKSAWNSNNAALMGVFGCMAFALTYQPLRYFPTALLTAWFFASAFSYKKY